MSHEGRACRYGHTERIDDASWDQEFVCYLAPYASELPAKQLKPLLEMKSFAKQDAEAEKNKEKERKKRAAGQKALEAIKLSIKGDELGGLSDEDEEIQQEEPTPKGQPGPQGWVRRPPSYELTEEELACGLWKIGTHKWWCQCGFCKKARGKVYENKLEPMPPILPGLKQAEWIAVARKSGSQYPNLSAMLTSMIIGSPPSGSPPSGSPPSGFPPNQPSSNFGPPTSGYEGQQSLSLYPQPDLPGPPASPHQQPGLPTSGYGGQQSLMVQPQPANAVGGPPASVYGWQQSVTAQQGVPGLPASPHHMHQPVAGMQQQVFPSHGLQQLQVQPLAVANQQSQTQQGSVFSALVQFDQMIQRQNYMNQFKTPREDMFQRTQVIFWDCETVIMAVEPVDYGSRERSDFVTLTSYLMLLRFLCPFASRGRQGSRVGNASEEFVLSDAALGDGERGLLYGELEVCRPQSTVERTMLGYVPEGFHTTDLSHCEPLCNIVQAESEAARAAAWRQYSVLARQGQARGADGRRRALQDGGGVQHCPDGQDICACTAQESADHGCAQLSVAADRYQCCTRSSPMASRCRCARLHLCSTNTHTPG
eukprot:g41224.t1